MSLFNQSLSSSSSSSATSSNSTSTPLIDLNSVSHSSGQFKPGPKEGVINSHQVTVINKDEVFFNNKVKKHIAVAFIISGISLVGLGICFLLSGISTIALLIETGGFFLLTLGGHIQGRINDRQKNDKLTASVAKLTQEVAQARLNHQRLKSRLQVVKPLVSALEEEKRKLSDNDIVQKLEIATLKARVVEKEDRAKEASEELDKKRSELDRVLKQNQQSLDGLNRELNQLKQQKTESEAKIREAQSKNDEERRKIAEEKNTLQNNLTLATRGKEAVDAQVEKLESRLKVLQDKTAEEERRLKDEILKIRESSGKELESANSKNLEVVRKSEEEAKQRLEEIRKKHSEEIDRINVLKVETQREISDLNSRLTNLNFELVSKENGAREHEAKSAKEFAELSENLKNRISVLEKANELLIEEKDRLSRSVSSLSLSSSSSSSSIPLIAPKTPGKLSSSPVSSDGETPLAPPLTPPSETSTPVPEKRRINFDTPHVISRRNSAPGPASSVRNPTLFDQIRDVSAGKTPLKRFDPDATPKVSGRGKPTETPKNMLESLGDSMASRRIAISSQSPGNDSPGGWSPS